MRAEEQVLQWFEHIERITMKETMLEADETRKRGETKEAMEGWSEKSFVKMAYTYRREYAGIGKYRHNCWDNGTYLNRILHMCIFMLSTNTEDFFVC